MILIGIGANLPSTFGPPRATCGAALDTLAASGLGIARVSSWWRTAPVPVSDQPWYVNAVVAVACELSPSQLLARLLAVERAFGRVRGAPNAARTLDLDLLDHHSRLESVDAANGLELPHPRLHLRAFVLLPLAEIAPDWRHPRLGKAIGELIAALPADQTAERMAAAAGAYGTEWQGTPLAPRLAPGAD